MTTTQNHLMDVTLSAMSKPAGSANQLAALRLVKSVADRESGGRVTARRCAAMASVLDGQSPRRKSCVTTAM